MEQEMEKCPGCGYVLDPETQKCLRCGYEPCQFCLEEEDEQQP